VFAQLVSDRLGIALDDIEFRQGDTDEIRSGQGTMGSRSLQTAGNSVVKASDEVLVRAKDLAAQLLEANVDDVVLDKADARFHVAGTPSVYKTWSDVASAAELPSFELVPMETPSPRNPLGAKGIGESGTIGATPAVQNAVVDALAHIGVRHVDMPLTAERVWSAIEGRTRPPH